MNESSRERGQIAQMTIAREAEVRLPARGRERDVCMDIFAAEKTVIHPGRGADVRTGIKAIPPHGYYYRVVGKGSSARLGLSFTLEVIDPGYRGEIILHPFNASRKKVTVFPNQAIAQLELVKITNWDYELVDESVIDADITDRGAGRMDSTRTGVSQNRKD